LRVLLDTIHKSTGGHRRYIRAVPGGKEKKKIVSYTKGGASIGRGKSHNEWVLRRNRRTGLRKTKMLFRKRKPRGLKKGSLRSGKKEEKASRSTTTAKESLVAARE